jgi:small ligand-binding sensory domain FIST
VLLKAGAGAAVHLDGFTAAGLAAHRALTAAAIGGAADLAVVFAGTQHGDDEFQGVLSAVERTLHPRHLIGCSATGVLTGSEELETGTAVAVLAVGGGGDDAAALPPPLLETGVRADARAVGLRLGRAAAAQLGGELEGAVLVVLVDPHDLDAAALLSGIAEGAPGLTVTGAGASGGDEGARIFAGIGGSSSSSGSGTATTTTGTGASALEDAVVALALPASVAPLVGTSHGCQGVSEALPITAAEGNVILEIAGRSPREVLREALTLPGNRPLEQLAVPLLAGIGERTCDGRSDYVVRPFLVPDDDASALAVAEPVRAGQTIRFTLRDAIGAREDMKAMLDEQAETRRARPPAFGLYFNCAGRGSALYGRSGLDPELIRRRFGRLPVAGIESSFEIAPACGRPRVHMFTGVLLLVG